MRVRPIVICGLLGSTFFFFFLHFLIKGTNLEKKVTDHKICASIFSTLLSGTFFILRRMEQGMIKMYIGLHVKCPIFLSDFNETWILPTDFRKTFIYQIS